MNMQKALQHLYKAVSGQDTSKVNISKLLVDIHQAVTGKESANKNNWSRIIDSMAENWSGGGENPNHVQTITGTATNPFGDGNIDYYANLSQAIQNKTATVIVHMGTAQILGIDLDMYIDSIRNAIFHGRYAFLPSDTNYMAFEAEWDRVNETFYLHSVSKESGYVDGSAYSGVIQTVTTIIWHPLP